MIDWIIARTVRDKFSAQNLNTTSALAAINMDNNSSKQQSAKSAEPHVAGQQQQQQQQRMPSNGDVGTSVSMAAASSRARCRGGDDVEADIGRVLCTNSIWRDPELLLYAKYTMMLRHNCIKAFVMCMMMFNLFAVRDVDMPKDYTALLAPQYPFFFINLCLLMSVKWVRSCNRLKYSTPCLSMLCWLLCIMQFLLHYYWNYTAEQLSLRNGIPWVGAITFLTLVALPAPSQLTILATAGWVICAICHAISRSDDDPIFGKQLFSLIVYIGTALVLGVVVFLRTQRTHLRAFNEAKQSLEAKMMIEEQSAEQERLLLSVLPEHVAVQMRQDLGAADSEQFKKIYMSRHENVSILYADIVGFTAISSTYSAQDLVKMLNELFARFDRLAEKYHQLRIKILGDCYYCISGAPVERPDHAALCVHMGLSMVKAIKYVQQKTNSPVDMRVGIHTGAILAGILGQRQWQFDVYSKDVELANKMESSGMAGRVHISEKTLSYLNGEFEVEPAFGEKREESLRIAGLKTYFIKKVLIPFKQEQIIDVTSTAIVTKTIETATAPMAVAAASAITATPVGLPKSDTLESIDAERISDASKAAESAENAPTTTSTATLAAPPNGVRLSANELDDADIEMEREFVKRLQTELLDRDRDRELQNELDFRYHFKKKEVERAYAKYCEPLQLLPYLAIVIVTICNSIIMLTILPNHPVRVQIAIIQPFVTSALVMIVLPEILCFLYRNRYSWHDLVHSECTHSGHLAKRGMLLLTLIIPMHYVWWFIMADLQVDASDGMRTNGTLMGGSATHQILIGDDTLVQLDIPKIHSLYAIWNDFHAAHGFLLMLCVVLMTNVPVTNRLALIAYANVLYLAGELWVKPGFHLENYLRWPLIRPGVVFAVCVLSAPLGLLARYYEMIDRVLFRWKTEVTEQKERASDMRRRNEALVYNILPVHVAEHFMGNKQRSYDDLYSQSYEEVGVLFASMPNFSDFYSEDTVNNQGLECLRFLNEVISDFDALLAQPRFQDVIKIKTISSTYMAASGLNPTRLVRADDPIEVRWEHLSLLVEFALELKKALQFINEQSFNHFVLKMGINHGPITAGVIGARKPHYDIWGNTVNVASRMESTGKAGAIQVTEQTCQILQPFGYTFEQRGLVAVKGKGQLMTYYLQGRTVKPAPAMSSPLETLDEEDEQILDVSECNVAMSPRVSKSAKNGKPSSDIADADAASSSVPLLSAACDNAVETDE